MAQPVWVLSVDLQTKTATFQSGMADAAKSARGAFQDIKSGAGDMGRETGYSMTEARHSVMLLGEEFGIKLPRALTSFIAGLGPVGAAMEAAFPFLAIAVGATLLIEHLVKMREEAEKLTDNQIKFGTAVSNAFNSLDEKLLQAGIRTDELSGNHLGALRLQLELIDRQSMGELVHSFDEVSKAADVVFAELKSNWYTFGIGSTGAQHALTEFKTQYDSLLAQGKDKEAADLLRGTRESAEHIRDMQKQALGSRQHSEDPTGADSQKKYNDYVAATNDLKKVGIGLSDKEVQSQEALVQALAAQEGVQQRVQALKNAQSGNATKATQNSIDGEAAARLNAQAEADRRWADLQQKDWEEAHNRALAALQQSEKEKIEVTDQASAVRLAAINAALKEEEKYGLQETAFYRDLLNQRLITTKQMADEEAKLKAEAGKEAADHAEKMGQIALAAQREHQALEDSTRHMTDQRRMTEAIKAANDEYGIQLTSFAQQIAALNKHDKEYENKLKAINDKQKQATQQHENEITAIKDRAEMDRNARILAAETRMQDEIARGLSNTIMRHQSFGSMMLSLGDQVASGMLQNAIKSILADDMTKEHDAAHAARKAFNAGMDFPFPANIVMGPALAAMAFASVMAFQGGGIVPGVGKGDIVPAMLEPGEGVIPKRLMDAARSGDSGHAPGHTVHVHVRPTYHVNTIDGDGMRDALDKHTDVLHRKFEHVLRGLNK